MKWIKIKIITSDMGIDRVSEIFEEMGLSSLEIEDSKEFAEVLDKTKLQWQWDFIDESLYQEKIKASSVSVYIAANQNAAQICRDTANRIAALKEGDTSHVYGSLEMLTTELDEEDWAENWKKYFKPLPVGKNILICPVWEDVPKEYSDRIVFKIDPGMSFGTGSHETTRLCIEFLEKYISRDESDTVLDMGCGSGILSIIAMLMGAKVAYAVDIDENCAAIAKNNAKINNIDLNNYTVYSGNLLTDKNLISELSRNSYNIVLMNIVPDVIIPLLPAAKKLLAPNGRVILSGIIERYRHDVESAIEQNDMTVADIARENDWVCVTAVL